MQLSKINRFKKQIKLRIPSGGSDYVTSLTPEYRIFSTTQGEQLKKDLEARFDNEEDRSKAYIDEIVIGVEGVEDADGKPLTPEAGREAIKDYPFLMTEIIKQFNESLSDLRVKN